MQHVKLNHEVVLAQYDAPRGQWHIRIRRTGAASNADEEESENEIDDVADVLLAAIGPISRWTLPDIAGIDALKDELHY